MRGFIREMDRGNVRGTLSDLFGIEYSDDVSKIVNGLDQYKKALSLVGDETAYTDAMQKEYEDRASTTAFQLQTLSNQSPILVLRLGRLCCLQSTASPNVLAVLLKALPNKTHYHIVEQVLEANP